MKRWVFSLLVFVLVVGAAIWLQYRFPDTKEAVLTSLGALIALGGTWFFSSRDTERAARYLAIRVVTILDKFIEDCVAVVKDDGLCYGQRTQDGCLSPQVKSPGAPAFPDDVDWKSIDHDLMYKILSFPSDVEAGDNAIAFIWDVVATPPDYDEGFGERAYQYAQFGLKAYELAKNLRSKYGIPTKDYAEWNPVSELQKELETIQTRRKKQEEANEHLINSLRGVA
jgi:hypothetical protein